MELIILTSILKWASFLTFIMAFVVWNAKDILNGFLKYMFLIGALCIIAGTGYPDYLVIINCIVFGLLGIIWRTTDNGNMLIKGYLMCLAFLHFYISMQ